MRKIVTVTLFAFSCLFFLKINGQTNLPIPVPEFLNQINFFEKQTNSLIKLEQTTAQLKSKIKSLGYGGRETQYQINGIASSIRLPSQEVHSFVVNLGGGMGEPSALYSLHKTEIKANSRQAVYMQISGIGKMKNNESLIQYNVRKLREGVFEIIPSVQLEKGEYFFVNKGTAAKYNGSAMDVFCFGVD